MVDTPQTENGINSCAPELYVVYLSHQ